MPISAQAIKKMRHDKTVTARNKKEQETVRTAVKAARKAPSKKSVSAAFSLLDVAAKHNLYHKNKADRLKARLSKLLVK